VVIMGGEGGEGGEQVIELDARGVALLTSWAHPRTQFRVTMQSDDSIVLHPMSRHEADLWRSGLADQIIEGFAHPERMIRVKPDKI
jgi:hypothetical protein